MKKVIDRLNTTIYDTDIIYYGLQVLLFNISTVLLILVVSYLNHNVYFGLFFTMFFGWMRVKYGGFHLKKAWYCISVMILLFTSILLLVNYSIISLKWILCGCSVICLYSLLKKQKAIFIMSLLSIIVLVCLKNKLLIEAFFYSYILFQCLYYLRYKKLYCMN